MDNKKIELVIQTNDDISADNQDIKIAFYSNIGFFIEVAQMLEYNIRKLICYHKSVIEIEEGEITKKRVEAICEKYNKYYLKTYKDKYTLGKLNKELECVKSIKKETFDIFNEINDYRILIVHKIFQNNIAIDRFRDSKYVNDYMKQRLLPMINKTNAINNMIINIINAYKEDLHAYKDDVGIPYEK